MRNDDPQSDYIPLHRTFHELSSNASESDDADLSQAFYVAGDLTWGELLGNYRVVVLSEAGSGKTEELRNIATELRADGKDAFFLRLENVPQFFEDAFEVGSADEFQEWLSSGREGWLLLDSVDEARLRHPQDFELAVKNLGHRARLALDRAHIVLSGRMSAWRPKTDLDKAKRYLPFAPTQTAAAPSDNEEDIASDLVDQMLDVDDDEETSGQAVSTATSGQKDAAAPFRIVTLDDLSREQVEMFAKARGVADTKKFCDAIERTDAWSFTGRPQDLEDLVAFWLDQGRIGGRLDIMRNSVARRLKERDQNRADSFPLSEERAFEGARLLAAATTLGRNSSIQVPDGADGLKGIPVEQVLPDWSAQERKTLLERPIFDAAIYGAVRFHHRTVREYLTADWLREMLSHPASRRAIEDMFFKTQYGVQVIVPVMRPVLPWLALFDEKVRDRVQHIAPEVLLEGGDPVYLPLPTRRKILADVTEEIAARPTPSSPTDFAAAQRFAHADIGDDIRRLLIVHEGNEDAASFLLRMIWVGQIKAALPEALHQALLPTARTYQRVAAIRAVKEIGVDANLLEVREALVHEDGPANREWLNEIVGLLVGTDDDIDWLLRAVTKTVALEKYAVDHLEDGVAKFVERCPPAQLPRVLGGFHGLLGVGPFVDAKYCRVSTRYGWLLHPAGKAVERLILAREPAATSIPALDTLQLIESSRHFGDDLRELKADFATLIPEWVELNRALFWSDVQRARGTIDPSSSQRITSYWQASIFGSLWKLGPEDFEYLCGQVLVRTEQDDKLVALSAAFEAYVLAGRKVGDRNELKRVVLSDRELSDRLNVLLNPPAQDDEFSRQERKWKQRARARERHEQVHGEKAREYVRTHVDVIRDPGFENPEDISRTQWFLHGRMRDKAEQNGKWTTGEWRSLIPEFGEDAARAFRDATVSHWRKANPKLLSEGATQNQTTASAIFGLSGLAIDAKETPHWATNLTSDEVLRACRFAAHELNGFPEWFPTLFAAHPEGVADFIMKELDYELAAEPEDGMHYIIDDLVWSGQWAWPIVGPRIFALLQSQEPRNGETLSRLLHMALASDVSDDAIISLVKLRLNLNDTRHAVHWFAVWTGIQPGEAIPAFDEYLASLASNEERVAAAMSYITRLFGDRRDDRPVPRGAFRTPPFLKDLYVLVHKYIQRSEDLDRHNGEAYSPTLRDRAQDARDSILTVLNETPGKEAYFAMTQIAEVESSASTKAWIDYRAHQKAQQDSNMAPWSPVQVRDFNDMQERTPANHRELAELVVNRVLDLKDDLENGDSSVAGILLGVTEETDMRTFLGRDLREMSASRYSIPQEEELADAKRPDLRFHGAGIDGPVPAELKLADKWTGPQLFERLENQLSGDYLRDRRSSRGVFLLVHQGKKKEWGLPDGTRANFDGLLVALKEHWAALSPFHPHVEELTIVGIDLTQRGA